MKTLRSTFCAMSLMTVALFFITSCSNEDELVGNVEDIQQNEERVPHYATMQLTGGLVGFDNATRSSDDWEHDDRIYLQFSVGSSIVDGVAIYDATTQEWNVQYHGTITTGAETKCEAYYFENSGEATRLTVDLDEHSAIYVDKSATYLFDGDVLKVSASLIPMTGRIRFKGEGTESYRLSGISYYNTYNINTNSFVTAELNLHSSKTNTDGYSEYYYGFFADETNKKICFDDYANCVSYTRSLGENALAVGRSGYLNIPIINNFNGWSLFTSKDFTVSNAKFRMIRVITESSYYYVGETEVTQELWKAVMGSNPSTSTGTNMPVETISYSEYSTFISKLCEKTGEKFYIPSAGDWQFAAKGAGASRAYTYSGSNNPDDVAWYSGNSNYTTHPVKTKLPNEIGIYDMSGNVSEWVDDYYRYSSSSYGYRYYGDSYASSDVKYGYNSYSMSALASVGARLFLKD